MVNKPTGFGRISTDLERRTLLQGLGSAGILALSGSSVGSGEQATTLSGDTFDPLEATVQEIRAAITSDRATAREITEQFLARIDAYEDTINAIITVNEDAVDRADELDAAYEESGPVGPLHGVPLVLKDNIDAEGLPTTAGALALEESFPPDDAFITSQLREAGCIVIGKANLDEFAGGPDGWSSLGKQTRNPYGVDRVPGGSSAGPGAGIATSYGVIGVGTDTGGSVVNPAAYSSLVGIRPTIGLLSRDGIVPVDLSQDTAGPLTRTVTDAALALDAMQGFDSADPVTARGASALDDDERYTDFLDADGLDGTRIGVVRAAFGAADNAGESPVASQEEAEAQATEVTDVIESAIQDMEQAGAEFVDPVDISDIEALYEGAEAPSSYKTYLNDYLESLGDDAPYNTVEELAASNGYSCSDAGSLREAAEAEEQPNLTESDEYKRAIGGKVALRDATQELLAEKDLDLLLYPTRSRAPPKIGEDSDRIRQGFPLSPLAGLPAISIPAGYTEDEELPVGVELLGLEFEEPLLIEAAYAYEQATMQRQVPDGFGPIPGDPPEVPNPDFSLPIATDGCPESD